jgi:putative phosphoribosyl transferase
MMFVDRIDAGRRLGRVLAEAEPAGPLLVLGLPRGGIPVACEVAAARGLVRPVRIGDAAPVS